MQAQIAWPLIQHLGKCISVNLNIGNGVILEIKKETVGAPPELDWNPKLPREEASGVYGYYNRVKENGRFTTVFQPDADVEKVRHYRSGKSKILYTEASGKSTLTLDTYVRGLGSDDQEVASIHKINASHFVLKINVDQLSSEAIGGGKSYRLLTKTGVPFSLVITTAISEKMKENIVRNNNDKTLKSLGLIA